MSTTQRAAVLLRNVTNARPGTGQLVYESRLRLLRADLRYEHLATTNDTPHALALCEAIRILRRAGA